MPLWKGQPYAPGPPSLNLSSDVQVFLIRFTGEIFTEFEYVAPYPKCFKCSEFTSEFLPIL